MAGKFTKTILKVGTYHSPDGVVKVTPERLRHWAHEFRRLSDARQVVPIHWDHGNDLDSLQPVALDAYRRRERSARNSVGRMTDFRLSRNGRSAEVCFETLDSDATKKVDSNAVYVSPVIFPKWKDGAGNQYRDLITHLDLVNHPVDHSQSPARRVQDPPVIACALRMGLRVKPFRLATEIPNVDEEDQLDDEHQAAPPGSDAGDDSAPVDDLPGDEDAGGESDPSPIDDSEPESGVPQVGDLMLALADHGIVLPHDTNDSNFLDRLRTALIAKTGANPGQDQAGPGGDTFDQTGETSVATPQIATMSLQARNALTFAGEQYRKTIKANLDYLLKTGRCSPAEHAQKSAGLSAVKLSLNSQGKPQSSPLTQWINSRKVLPKGACWSPTEKLRRMSATPVQHPPERKLISDGKLTDDEATRLAKELLKR